jgi:hypothetical protein
MLRRLGRMPTMAKHVVNSQMHCTAKSGELNEDFRPSAASNYSKKLIGTLYIRANSFNSTKSTRRSPDSHLETKDCGS